MMASDAGLNSAEIDRGLLQRVKSLLYRRGYGPHRTLGISVERGVVLIQGRVPTFYLRQIAVEWIKRVAGVVRVVDLIEVVDGAVQPGAGTNVEVDSGPSDRRCVTV